MSLVISGGNLGWLAGGTVAGLVLARFLKGPGGSRGGVGADPALLPDPALDWLRRVHGAKGVWISNRATVGEAPTWHTALDGQALSPS